MALDDDGKTKNLLTRRCVNIDCMTANIDAQEKTICPPFFSPTEYQTNRKHQKLHTHTRSNAEA